MRNDADKKRSMCLGYVLQLNRGWVASRKTREHPDLAILLCRFASERYPDFKFSSIMVNVGGSALHVDKGNCGPSLNHRLPIERKAEA